MQDVDGLQPSDYLLETAKEHIEGKIDIATAQKRISIYYEQRNERLTAEQDTMEADIVASRIAELLAEKTFQFSPAELQSIHQGNTRTTAVFMIKYLQTFVFSVSNQVFADNSWYFLNALGRANYNDLKNRYMHIDYTEKSQSAKIALWRNWRYCERFQITLRSLKKSLQMRSANPIVL